MADEAGVSKAALKRVKDVLIGAKVVDAGANEAALEQGVKDLITRATTSGDTTVKVPVVSSTPNPQDADKHYAAGLSRYFSRRYADAEAEFLRAIANDSQDARFYYFLGLSRFLQGKPASYDFAQGAALEQQDRPGQEAVSRALERVQGQERMIVNESRRRLR
jgi:TolA-binding protein